MERPNRFTCSQVESPGFRLGSEPVVVAGDLVEDLAEAHPAGFHHVHPVVVDHLPVVEHGDLVRGGAVAKGRIADALGRVRSDAHEITGRIRIDVLHMLKALAIAAGHPALRAAGVKEDAVARFELPVAAVLHADRVLQQVGGQERGVGKGQHARMVAVDVDRVRGQAGHFHAQLLEKRVREHIHPVRGHGEAVPVPLGQLGTGRIAGRPVGCGSPMLLHQGQSVAHQPFHAAGGRIPTVGLNVHHGDGPLAGGAHRRPHHGIPAGFPQAGQSAQFIGRKSLPLLVQQVDGDPRGTP